jgi:lipopolysaccharide/colanic/teichoic acid biosynthesis glycosyltransferase
MSGGGPAVEPTASSSRPDPGPDRFHDGPLRRLIDVIASLSALLLLSPLFLLLAIAIKLDSRGPVLFSQPRMGRGERLFRIYKLRTMVKDAAKIGPKISGTADPRITRLGAFLRATKLDELPQLWNVLKGEVTLIGPRAEVPEMLPHYTAEERATLQVRPGLTGCGQLYFTTDQADDLDEVDDVEAHYIEHQLHPKLQLDLEYLRDRRLARDFAVLWTTLKVVLRFGR